MDERNERISESHVTEERKHAMVMVGDVNGFGRWARKAVEDPRAYRRFMAELYDAFLEYRNATGGWVKLVGDGLLAVHELAAGQEAAVAELVFLQSFRLKKVIRHSIMGQMFPRPDGFRVRLGAGWVWKVLVEMNGESLIDYNGYWINAPFRFTEVYKSVPCVAHTSAIELLPPDFHSRTLIDFVRLPADKRTPDGIDREDMVELHEFKIQPLSSAPV